MVGEVETKDLVKQFEASHGSNKGDDMENSSPITRKKNNANDNVINYFSMNDDDIVKVRNKIKDNQDELFKDLEPKENKALQNKKDEHGWDDEDLSLVIE